MRKFGIYILALILILLLAACGHKAPAGNELIAIKEDIDSSIIIDEDTNEVIVNTQENKDSEEVKAGNSNELYIPDEVDVLGEAQVNFFEGQCELVYMTKSPDLKAELAFAHELIGPLCRDESRLDAKYIEWRNRVHPDSTNIQTPAAQTQNNQAQNNKPSNQGTQNNKPSNQQPQTQTPAQNKPSNSGGIPVRDKDADIYGDDFKIDTDISGVSDPLKDQEEGKVQILDGTPEGDNFEDYFRP